LLVQEHGQTQKLENSRMLPKHQNKEIEATIAALKSEIANLEGQLATQTGKGMAQAGRRAEALRRVRPGQD